MLELLINQPPAPVAADALVYVMLDHEHRAVLRYDRRDGTVCEAIAGGEAPVSPAVTAAVRDAVATIAAALQASQDGGV